jgi:serine/threonine-protein kinase
VLRGGPAAGAIAPRVAARIVADACAGLHAAHEAVDDDGTPLAVVHRDVSPHNVLLAIDGHVKVTDFGVAKALGKSHTTQAGQAKGKLAYMAPEQLCGPATDRRADVFALGCVLYEITTARKPFEGESDADVMKAVLRCEPTAPGVLVPGYPAELERIVQLAMARDPDDRFASAEGLRLALERWLAASGAAVAQREVASLVHARCGAEIEHRRAVIQQAMAIEPRVAVAPVVGAQAALGELGPPRRPRRGILALGAAVVALAVGSLVWHRPVEEARIEAPTPPDAPAVVVAPTAPVVAPPPTEREPSAPAASRIVLRVEPSRARVVVDGEPLPPDDDEGTFSFDRPPPGHSRLVLVKALGRVDARVVVDAATAPAVDLSLEQAEPSVLSSR